MTRRALAILALFFVSPAYVSAQGVGFRVESASASVHKAPSIGSPVIGQAPRGLALEVTRDLGSWVKVSWPDAPDAIGYIHVSTGTRIGAALPTTGEGAALRAVPAERVAAGRQSAAPQPSYVMPAHIVGLGGQLGGSTIGAGINARTWFNDRLGLQLEASRSSLTSTTAAERLTATQFAPSLLYSLSSLVTDYVWVRPYVGAGPRVVRRSLGLGSQTAGVPVSQNSVGFQTFGGGELTFSSLPRLSLSADLRYGWIEDAQPAFELDGWGFSISAHWYVR